MKPVLLAALCALASAAPAADDTLAPRPRPAATAIRVVTANLRVPVNGDYATGNGWNQRRELCRDTLLAQDADIICFQECRSIQLNFIKEKFPGFEHFAIENAPKANARAEPTIAILYSAARFKQLRAGGFWLSDTPSTPNSRFDDSAFPRLANWVLLQDSVTGGAFVVWNTHLDHISGPVGDSVRERQIAVLLAQAGKIPSDLPQILTGDFNTTAGSNAIRAVKTAGWADSYAVLHGPDDPGSTYHGFLGKNYTKKSHGKIDFIFFNGPLKPLASEIVRDEQKGRYPSDHYFISADFEFAKTVDAPAALKPGQTPDGTHP
ncbi:endonuclease/exonuclease/phosphatase family protein [Termitidicoccus mucosus]